MTSKHILEKLFPTPTTSQDTGQREPHDAEVNSCEDNLDAPRTVIDSCDAEEEAAAGPDFEEHDPSVCSEAYSELCFSHDDDIDEDVVQDEFDDGSINDDEDLDDPDDIAVNP